MDAVIGKTGKHRGIYGRVLLRSLLPQLEHVLGQGIQRRKGFVPVRNSTKFVRTGKQSQVDPPEMAAQSVGVLRSHERAARHSDIDALEIVKQGRNFAIAVPPKAAVIDVRGADNDIRIIHDHKLTMYVDLLCVRFIQAIRLAQVVVGTEAEERYVLVGLVLRHVLQETPDERATAAADGLVLPAHQQHDIIVQHSALGKVGQHNHHAKLFLPVVRVENALHKFLRDRVVHLARRGADKILLLNIYEVLGRAY
mmetsp:Transcript_19121/g.53674  ORF Transcript_19121/g.53674 Transcript_19121/m.53674 type:complete len:253 (+) Transcript_19121:1026-1784(+)